MSFFMISKKSCDFPDLLARSLAHTTKLCYFPSMYYTKYILGVSLVYYVLFWPCAYKHAIIAVFSPGRFQSSIVAHLAVNVSLALMWDHFFNLDLVTNSIKTTPSHYASISGWGEPCTDLLSNVYLFTFGI